MEITFYETAMAFREACGKYLRQEEAENNMFLGNVDTAVSVSGAEKYMLGAVSEQDRVVLVFLGNPKGQLFLYASEKQPNPSPYAFLADALLQAGFPAIGVKAAPLTAKLFAQEYSKRAKRKYRIHMRMNILLLTKLQPIKLLDLAVKKITENGEYDLSAEQLPFIREAIHAREGLYFLIKNGVPVSQASIRRKVSMGGVYTPQEHRRNGYSSTLVFHLAKYILDDGNPYCVVHTDATNEISNQMYYNIGFEHCADMLDIAIS